MHLRSLCVIIRNKSIVVLQIFYSVDTVKWKKMNRFCVVSETESEVFGTEKWNCIKKRLLAIKINWSDCWNKSSWKESRENIVKFAFDNDKIANENFWNFKQLWNVKLINLTKFTSGSLKVSINFWKCPLSQYKLPSSSFLRSFLWH